VVAATNADLDQLVASGRFRDDLFYRLNVVRVKVPPLRERREEIPLLVRSVIERTVREHQREPVRFSDDALEHLCLYSWPGNTRQLVNELNRLIALLEPGTVVLPEHLSVEITDSPADLARLGRPFDDWTSAEIRPLSDAVGALERRLIRQSLERSKGNTVQAAAELGLSRKGLFLKRRRLGI
jgi:DNA-binding NtrC family response regulator